jgi:hypothetical protein
MLPLFVCLKCAVQGLDCTCQDFGRALDGVLSDSSVKVYVPAKTFSLRNQSSLKPFLFLGFELLLISFDKLQPLLMSL